MQCVIWWGVSLKKCIANVSDSVGKLHLTSYANGVDATSNLILLLQRYTVDV
uniref:Uncharacterized protein n=1 Tax=Anguilla anguilla TaxID=7936 RepID=A0A0E9TQF2_ANGAN